MLSWSPSGSAGARRYTVATVSRVCPVGAWSLLPFYFSFNTILNTINRIYSLVSIHYLCCVLAETEIPTAVRMKNWSLYSLALLLLADEKWRDGFFIFPLMFETTSSLQKLGRGKSDSATARASEVLFWADDEWEIAEIGTPHSSWSDSARIRTRRRARIRRNRVGLTRRRKSRS